MKNLFIFLIITLFFSACTLKKVTSHHGVHFLEKKQEKLLVNISNKNDIVVLLGTPSTKSTFDNNIWIYLERKSISSELKTFGKEKLTVNNVLLLEINKMGMLMNKKLYTLGDYEDIKFTKKETTKTDKDSFVYGFISSLKQKIDRPKRRSK